MSDVTSVPKWLKYIECNCGIEGKNSPMCYVPKQSLIEDVLETKTKTKTKTAYFKVTRQETGSELQVAIWASGIPEHFLIHVLGAVHIIKRMGLATKLKEQVDAVEALKHDWEITKDTHSMCKKTNKVKKDDDSNPAVAGGLGQGGGKG
jgi:hypothetical protein